MSEPVALKNLRPGQTARVVAILARDPGRLHKLTAYGLRPGVLVTLEQCRPAYLLRVGETLLSLDGEVTADILADIVD